MDKFIIIKQLLFLVLVLFVLFAPNKLSKKVRYIGLAAVVIFGFIVFEPTAHSFNDVHNDSVFNKYAPQTELSEKATHLKVGMTKSQVLKILGKPTWVEHMKGIQLALIWKNGACNPVFVTFDKHMRVNGMDEGRAKCLSKEYPVHLSKELRCVNPENKQYCE